MIYAKSTRYGLESQIYWIQNYLNSNLPWSGDIDIYGIIFKNEKKDGIIPEAWINNKDYKQIYTNDKKSATISFLINERTTDGQLIASVDIIFCVNLNKIYGEQIRYQDKALLDAQYAIEQSGRIFDITEIKETIPVIFSEFNTDYIKYRDMQPFYNFSLTAQIPYSDNVSKCINGVF